MKTSIGLIILILAFGIVQPASASALDGTGQQLGEYATGQELLDKLNSPNATERASGMYYVLGILDGYHVGSSSETKDPRLSICLTPPVSVEDIVGVVKKYLHNKPSSLPESAPFTVVIALHKRWPCK